MKKIFAWIKILLIGCWLQTACAEDNSYLLGPGDVLKISVYNNPDLSLEARVAEAGSISFPLVGEIQVGGITPLAAEKKIADLLQKGGFIVQPQVSILVTQYLSKLISVLGSVLKPGRYPLDRATNLADLLALVGGITPDGSDLITIVGKDGKTEFDMRDILGEANQSKNINLSGGEIVYVARAPKAYIYGEVQRPGSFRIERNMTVLQALAQGGGPTVRGTQRNVQVYRRNQEGIVVKSEAEMADPVMQDDVLYVQESLF